MAGLTFPFGWYSLECRHIIGLKVCLECVRESREVVHALLHPVGKDPQTVVEVNQRQLRETDYLVVGEFPYANLTQSILEGVEDVVEGEEEVCQSLSRVEVLLSLTHHRLTVRRKSVCVCTRVIDTYVC